jgi:hypothetical protein
MRWTSIGRAGSTTRCSCRSDERSSSTRIPRVGILSRWRFRESNNFRSRGYAPLHRRPTRVRHQIYVLILCLQLLKASRGRYRPSSRRVIRPPPQESKANRDSQRSRPVGGPAKMALADPSRASDGGLGFDSGGHARLASRRRPSWTSILSRVW